MAKTLMSSPPKRSTFLRHTTVLFLLLAGGLSMVLFSVKYQVHDLEAEQGRLVKELDEERRSLHVLRAEWANLNDPKRIRELAHLHLGMTVTKPAQVLTLDGLRDIPLRETNVGTLDMVNTLDSVVSGEVKP